MKYDFIAPRQIVFGWGRRQELARLAGGLGRRVFVVVGSRTLAGSEHWRALNEQLAAAGIRVVQAGAALGEPTIEDVDELTGRLRAQSPGAGDWVLGVGGGSAVDLAKAAAALAVQPEFSTARDYLEGVGRGLQLSRDPLPVVAMPTTGGTGSEATKNAVISVADPPVKKSLRSPAMVPRLVLVDPELTTSVSPQITAWTGMDAITQLIESYISRYAQPVAQALCIDGLRRALPALTTAVREPGSQWAREAMAHAALLSGMALANSGLGLAHGVAAALGSMAGVPHGLACAVMLPVALEVNRHESEPALAELARAVLPDASGNDAAAADALLDRVGELLVELKIPRRLRELNVKPEQLDELVHGSRGNSMNGNPRQLDDDQLRQTLERCL